MTNLLQLFAHDASLQNEETSNIEHVLADPLLVPALIVGSSIFIYLLLTKIFRFSVVGSVQLICAFYLVAGVGLIRYAPIYSALLFAVGTITTLLIVLLSLQDSA